jgi:UDPglucose 6-dehydrogenase
LEPICWRVQWQYSTKCPHIQVTVVDLNVERIAAWNDEDLDNIPIYEPGLIKLWGSKRKKLILSTDVKKAIDEAQVILSRLHPLKPMEKEKGWQPI